MDWNLFLGNSKYLECVCVCGEVLVQLVAGELWGDQNKTPEQRKLAPDRGVVGLHQTSSKPNTGSNRVMQYDRSFNIGTLTESYIIIPVLRNLNCRGISHPLIK